ncbi:MAG: ABC transporter ATP-binding protein [Verrucomicrobiota bacterium]
MLRSLKPFLELLRPYRSKVILSILLGSIAGLATGGGLAKGAEVLFSSVLSKDADLSRGQIMSVAALFPALFLVIGSSSFASAYLLNSAGLGAIRDLRQRLFGHLQSLPLAYFQKSKSGDLVSRLTADPQMLQVTLNFFARNVLTQPATIVGSIGYLTHKALSEAGVLQIYICILILPIVIFPIRYFSRKVEKKARAQQDELGQLTNRISQNLTAAREVRAFNLEARENKSFSDRVSAFFVAQMKVVKYSYSLGPAVEIISSIGLSIAFLIGYNKGIDSGTFTAIFLSLYLTYASIKKLGAFISELKKGKAALDRINEVLEEPIAIENPESPIIKDLTGGEIAFENVSFAYDNAPALDQVSVLIPKDSVSALVGPSGAGKSTFANLVPRFYDVESGSIRIDGVDIRKYELHMLRAHIAIVSQDPVLFDDTIFENIKLGRQDATEQEIVAAAKNAFADEFIVEMESGYETIVGERGTRLSGGQKQRIAIARAFLRNAPILILDEATSALDSEGEKKIQQALDKLVIGKTVLIIAHRFSTIRSATQILVFKDGRIIDSGKHSELYNRCALYNKLYDQQQAAL